MVMKRNSTSSHCRINQKKIKELVKKDNLIYEEDKILLYKLYHKLKKEFQDIDKSKL